MHDPVLADLLSALDEAPTRPAPVPSAALATAQERLVRARALLGHGVAESAYLAFARHLTPRTAPTTPVAASA
jgi:hypothetical protein